MLSGEREIVLKKLQFKLKGVIVSYCVDTSQLGMEKLALKSKSVPLSSCAVMLKP